MTPRSFEVEKLFYFTLVKKDTAGIRKLCSAFEAVAMRRLAGGQEASPGALVAASCGPFLCYA